MNDEFYPEERLGDLVVPKAWPVALGVVGVANLLVGLGVLVAGCFANDVFAFLGVVAGFVLIAAGYPALHLALRPDRSRQEFFWAAMVAVAVAWGPPVSALILWLRFLN
ncbi:MAG: hypothetical protein AAGE52_42735 [Myxococcota bacterium]